VIIPESRRGSGWLGFTLDVRRFLDAFWLS
jgi:hypothetical protein